MIDFVLPASFLRGAARFPWSPLLRLAVIVSLAAPPYPARPLPAAEPEVSENRAAAPADPEQDAKDANVVETVLRIPGFDLSKSAKAREAVERYLASRLGAPRYFEVVEKLRLRSETGRLLELAAANPGETAGVKALELLLAFEERGEIEKALAGENGPAIAAGLGYLGNEATLELLAQPAVDPNRGPALRTAAVTALGRSRLGQLRLLEIVEGGKLPPDAAFAAANALLGSADAAIRERAGKHLELPATAGAAPLPPLAELVERRGEAARGREVFLGVGTCIKCHKVAGEGKEIGPDLSEIGGKLSREAMYVSILDPNAGISHGYETFAVFLESGNVVTGLMTSRTEEELVIKTAEGIERTIPVAEVEEVLKQPVSLMPADLQKLMTLDQLIDVVEYLATLKRAE